MTKRGWYVIGAVIAVAVTAAVGFAYQQRIGVTFQGQVALTYRGNTMSAMNCEIYTQDKFDEILKIQASEPLAKAPGDNDRRRTTTFVLKGFGLSINPDDVILSIQSGHASGVIYAGPFKESLQISTFEETYSLDRGWDSFDIMFANKRMRQICSASHSAEFWQADKSVVIEMLKFRELDKNGYPVAFKVYSQG